MMQDWLNDLLLLSSEQIARYPPVAELKLYLCCKSWSHKKYFKHLQYAVLCFICVCLMSTASAQTVIKGTVTDKKKVPVENASSDKKFNRCNDL
jgi:hypothetical protein